MAPWPGSSQDRPTVDYFEILDREQLLATYGADISRLDALVANLDGEVLHFRPAIDGAWTIAENIGHLASTEVNGYLRFQKAILNPGATIDVGNGDMEKSAAILGYAAASASDALQLIRTLRKITHDHACRIKDQDWNRYHIQQPSHPIMKAAGLGMILSFHTQHFAFHLDLIRRNLAAYENAKAV
jgi:hypothetical protein